MMDPHANINQVSSYINEYEENLVSSSNMPIDDTLDKKIGHYWSKYVTMEVLSEVN